MITTEIKIKGLAELQRKLVEFPDKIQRIVADSAVKGAADIVLQDAKARFQNVTHTRTGRTLKHIKKGKARSRLSSQTIYSVGINRYGMFVELGTKGHIIAVKNKKVLASRKFVLGPVNAAGNASSAHTEFQTYGKRVKHPTDPAKPFLRPALYNNTNIIIEAMRKDLAASLALMVK